MKRKKWITLNIEKANEWIIFEMKMQHADALGGRDKWKRNRKCKKRLQKEVRLITKEIRSYWSKIEIARKERQ